MSLRYQGTTCMPRDRDITTGMEVGVYFIIRLYPQGLKAAKAACDGEWDRERHDLRGNECETVSYREYLAETV